METHVVGKKIQGGCEVLAGMLSDHMSTVATETLSEFNYVNLFGPLHFYDQNITYNLFKCNDTEALADLSILLATPPSALTGQNVTCKDAFSNQEMIVKICNRNELVSFCVGCRDPCGIQEEDKVCDEKHLSPCSTTKCPSDHDFLKIFIARYATNHLSSIPKIVQPIKFSATNKSISVAVEVTNIILFLFFIRTSF